MMAPKDDIVNLMQEKEKAIENLEHVLIGEHLKEMWAYRSAELMIEQAMMIAYGHMLRKMEIPSEEIDSLDQKEKEFNKDCEQFFQEYARICRSKE